MKTTKTHANNDEKDHSKKIIILIIVVIIILLLVTSCGCTSRFFGKLGDPLMDDINNAFKNEKDHSVDDKTNDKETILNEELKFDVSSLEMLLKNERINIGYTYKTIKPKELTCSTSDASIATCYVSNGYVVVIAKSTGIVTVTLQTNTNGKIYAATTKVNIIDPIESNEDSYIVNNPNNNASSGNNNNNGNNDNEKDKEEYKLYSYQKKYNINYVNSKGEGVVILNSNMFTSKTVNVMTANDKKKINVCSKDNNFCVELTVDGNNDYGNIQLEYIGEKQNFSSLPFKIVANSVGKSIIHVLGIVRGEKIADFDIEINVGQKYSVIINANGGLFNEFETEYQFEISPDEKIDLTKYDEPYKMDSECNLYKFIGYSTSPNGKVEYDTKNKNIIENLSDNLTLYAIYETESTHIDEPVLQKTLWLTDVELFHNEEYYKKYKEDKVIYPGASGVYLMNFKNNSSNKITITGLTLKENTICIDNKRCLNMGYIIKYSSSDSNDWTYYYGDKNSKYWILHSRPDTVKLSDNVFKSEIVFKDNEKIQMNPNEDIVISIFWKWEEIDDNLDTLIGNHAAKSIYDKSINDMYGISIGVNFETDLDSCKN